MNFCIDCQHYGRGPYGVVEVCLLEEVTRGRSPVDGSWNWPPDGTREYRGRCYTTCRGKRLQHPDCPDYTPWPPIKWWQVWKWFR